MIRQRHSRVKSSRCVRIHVPRLRRKIDPLGRSHANRHFWHDFVLWHVGVLIFHGVELIGERSGKGLGSESVEDDAEQHRPRNDVEEGLR